MRRAALAAALASALVVAAIAVAADPAGWGVPSIIGKGVTFRLPASGQTIVDADTTDTTTTTGAFQVDTGSATANARGVYSTFNQTANASGQACFYGTFDAAVALTGTGTRYVYDALPRGDVSDAVGVESGAFRATDIGVVSSGRDVGLRVGTGPYDYAILAGSGSFAWTDASGTLETRNDNGGASDGLTIRTAVATTSGAGGDITIAGGAGAGPGVGAGISISPGAGGATNAAAGDVTFTLTAGGGSGDDADVIFTCNDSSQIVIDAATTDTTITTGVVDLDVDCGSALATCYGADLNVENTGNTDLAVTNMTTVATAAVTGANRRATIRATLGTHVDDTGSNAFLSLQDVTNRTNSLEAVFFAGTGLDSVFRTYSGNMEFVDYVPVFQTLNGAGGASEGMTFQIADASGGGNNAAGNWTWTFGNATGTASDSIMEFDLQSTSQVIVDATTVSSSLTTNQGALHVNYANANGSQGAGTAGGLAVSCTDNTSTVANSACSLFSNNGATNELTSGEVRSSVRVLTNGVAGDNAAGVNAGIWFDTLGTASAGIDTGLYVGATNLEFVFRMASGAIAHLHSDGSTPTLSSCGTGPAITGNDIAGKITFGTGAPTACTATFATAYGSAPACTLTCDQTGVNYRATTSTTALSITASADASSDVCMYFCIQAD